MSTPERRLYNPAPSAPRRYRVLGIFGFHSRRVLHYPHEDNAVHNGIAGHVRRNLFQEFDSTDPKGRDFADDKNDSE